MHSVHCGVNSQCTMPFCPGEAVTKGCFRQPISGMQLGCCTVLGSSIDINVAHALAVFSLAAIANFFLIISSSARNESKLLFFCCTQHCGLQTLWTHSACAATVIKSFLLFASLLPSSCNISFLMMCSANLESVTSLCSGM